MKEDSSTCEENFEKEETLICEHFEAEVPEDENILFDSEILCSICPEKRIFICYRCGNRHWREEANSSRENEICGSAHNCNFTS